MKETVEKQKRQNVNWGFLMDFRTCFWLRKCNSQVLDYYFCRISVVLCTLIGNKDIKSVRSLFLTKNDFTFVNIIVKASSFQLKYFSFYFLSVSWLFQSKNWVIKPVATGEVYLMISFSKIKVPQSNTLLSSWNKWNEVLWCRS